MADRSKLSDSLHRELFADKSASIYAILDGASVPGLLEKLAEHAPEYTCLFSGQLDPDLAEAAPYLVRLDPADPFTDWVLERGWGNHWGIFAALPASAAFKAVRKHLRSFLRVRSPEGKPLLFRYYDPRVFRVYLPTCNGQELRTVFGPVRMFMLESEQADELMRFTVAEGALTAQRLAVAGRER